MSRSPPLRVLYFVSNYHRLTGSQRSLFLLVSNLDRGLVEPLVVFPGEGACTRHYRDAGLRVLVEEPPPALDQFGGGLLRAGLLERIKLATTAVAPYSRRIGRLMKSERIQIAHFNNSRSTLMAGLGALGAGIPRIWHLRSDERSLGSYRTFCAAIANRIISVADGIRSSIPAPFLHKCRTVYNGIDPPTAPPTRDRAALLAALDPPLALGPDDVLFVAVGSVIPFKGPHHLIEAVARLGERDATLGKRVHVVFVGDRPVEAYGRHLDALIAARRPYSIRFAGWDDRPLDWMRAADVVVLPTVERETLVLADGPIEVHGTEGFSRSVLEAMCCERPVVATRVAGVPEQIQDGVNGLVVPPSDPAALAEAIARIAVDRAAWPRMGAAGGRAVRRFSVAAMCAATVGVYRELVD